MKRLVFSVFVTLLFSLSAFAQSEGINFQGVARNAAGEVLVSQKINLRLSILLGSETGAVAYMETRLATTNPQGVFAVVVGDDKALTKSINFSTINWTPAPKFIKVEMDPNAGSNYLVMGTSRLQAVPFAFYAYGVDANNVKGVLPASKGGTGVTSITDLKTSLGLDNFSNAALDTKVDKVAGKGLSSNNYTTAEKNKLEAITGTNTGDQDLSGYATTAQLATKANAAIVTTSLATKANISDVTTSLAAKEDVSNKSNAALGTSRTLYPTQNAVKTYVDAQVSSATIADANTTTKGKLQLAGDLTGDASAPIIASGAINSAKIQDRSIATVDVADLAITDEKISGISGSKVVGNIAGNAANVTGTVAVGNGGTGATGLTGYVKGNGSTAMTSLSSIPVADVTGAIRKVNGTLPNSSGEVTIFFGAVTTGTLAARPSNSGVNGDIYVVSGDGNAINNGRTFISNGTQWNEVTANVASTDARYLQLAGGIMDGNLSIPTGKRVIIADAPSGSTDAANKGYVDAQIASGAPDANATTKGKLQLAGDLTGDASAPAIASGAVTSTKIADATIVNADIALAAAIEDTKLATIATAGKVSNSATTATSVNTNSAIVARDTNGNFSAGTITANLTGNATNVTGTVAVANGGTGATDLTGYVKGNGSTAMTSVSSIPVADVTGAIRKVNGTLPNSSGEVTIFFGEVTTGTLANRPSNSGDNGDIYVVSGDGNAIDNGRTFISNGTQWNEVTANVASTDARYLQLAGGIMDGNLSIPTGKKVMITDAPSGSTDAANKGYVDAKIAADAPNATSSIPGKVQLAGDLGGSAASPTVPGLALKAPIESPTFTGTVGGITKSMVGLGNVDNTADADKPVSSAAQTALDLKENASNKSDAALGTSTTLFPTQNAVKTYVDAQISNATIADADASTKGKVRLAGDLAGTNSSATSPIISNLAISTAKLAADAVTSAKILDGEIVNADISTTAAIADSKLATISTSGKVSNSATTATDGNTASAIVARDDNGNFSAGTITASLTGNATNVTGTVAVANGGTGATSANTNVVFAGPASGAAAAPSFRALVAADLPSGSTSYINNTTTQQTASFNISGSGTMATNLSVGGTATITGTTTLTSLDASKAVFTNTSKQLTTTGTLGVSQGGTGVTGTPTNGQILIGNGTGFTLANLTQGTGITITNSSGSISIAAAVRPTTDQFSATANQLTFTLSQTPLTNANSKDNVWMFINGVRTNNDAYSVSGTTVTYVPGSNGSYALLLGDRIQFDYAY